MTEKIKRKTLDRIDVFAVDPFDPILDNHQLHGEYDGCRSFNVTGDLRIIYRKTDSNTYLLLDVGTHSQLYE